MRGNRFFLLPYRRKNSLVERSRQFTKMGQRVFFVVIVEDFFSSFDWKLSRHTLCKLSGNFHWNQHTYTQNTGGFLVLPCCFVSCVEGICFPCVYVRVFSFCSLDLSGNDFSIFFYLFFVLDMMRVASIICFFFSKVETCFKFETKKNLAAKGFFFFLQRAPQCKKKKKVDQTEKNPTPTNNEEWRSHTRYRDVVVLFMIQ